MPENITINIDEFDIDGVDVDGRVTLSLSTNATPDELLDRCQHLSELSDQASTHMVEVRRWWADATDTDAKDRFWVEFQTATREFRVVAAWTQLFYTAFIFCTDGAECAALDGPHLG